MFLNCMIGSYWEEIDGLPWPSCEDSECEGNPGEGDTKCDQSPSTGLNMTQPRRWKGHCLPYQEKQCGNWHCSTMATPGAEQENSVVWTLCCKVCDSCQSQASCELLIPTRHLLDATNPYTAVMSVFLVQPVIQSAETRVFEFLNWRFWENHFTLCMSNN
jgi:hypothetical protein